MNIYGAGMAGLLAAHMLRRHRPQVHEVQSSLPNNHSAVLRFRSDAVSRATGIPFRSVQVQKAIWLQDRLHTRADLRMSNLYSLKVTGDVINRSIMNLEPVERWVSPPDFIQQMAHSCRIHYESPLDVLHCGGRFDEPVISTIPMPALMAMMKWEPRPTFSSRSIQTFSCDIIRPSIDIFQTIYYPDPEGESHYRASITGNHLTIEMVGTNWPYEPVDKAAAEERLKLIWDVCSNFGITIEEIGKVNLSTQKFGKISPIPSEDRKAFILALTDRFNIYSVGRFATWRQILLDDVVHDINVVESFIVQRDSYQRKITTHQN